MKILIVIILILSSRIANAQVEVVSAVKNDLVARQVSLVGPCGAFEITKRVAWVLRKQEIGLLSKPAGNNCQGYSPDFLTRLDGSGLDILGDGGGLNIPAWYESEPPGALMGQWREPFDPGDTSPEPEPTPTPVPPTELLQRVITIEQVVAQMRQMLSDHEIAESVERQHAQEFRERVGHEYAKVGRFLAKYGPIVAAGLAAGKWWGDK